MANLKPAALTVLERASFEVDDHQLKELPLRGKINLRGEAANHAFLTAVKKAIGQALPAEMNTISRQAKTILFKLGPDEWLIDCPLKQLEQNINCLRAQLKQQHAAITDISDYYTSLRLSSPQARTILASGTALDLRASKFQAGQCAQTRFSQASILLWPLEDEQGFDIQIRWSFAQYLFDYLSQSIENISNVANNFKT